MGLGEKNTARIVDEMARKGGFSLEFLYLHEMSRLRGGGRSRMRTFLPPQFPANREKYREYRCLSEQLDAAQAAF